MANVGIRGHSSSGCNGTGKHVGAPQRRVVSREPLSETVPKDRQAEDPQSVEKRREAQISRTREGGGCARSQCGLASASAAAICVKVLHTLK